MRRALAGEETAAGGYLCFQEAEHGREWWAALLVVDRSGLPHEFLYAGPVRPTPVQSILYQDRLDGEVRLTLLRALLRGLRSRPAFLAAAEDEAGEWLAEAGGAPLLAVAEGAAAWTWRGLPGPDAEAAAAALESTVGTAEPLGRAVAALAYVVEYERSRGTGEPR